jgi:hypothetical protein
MPKFTHTCTVEKINKKIGRTPMFRGGSPLFKVRWEVPCHAQHKTIKKKKEKKENILGYTTVQSQTYQ